LLPQGGNWQNPVAPPLFLCYNDLRGKLKMSVKLVLLKSGETVIADAKELISDGKVCGYLFTNPHKIEVSKTVLLIEENDDTKGDLEISLSPWIVLTIDTEIPVTPDWVVTIVEPIETIKKMYEEKVNVQNSEVSFTEN
jgi:hypothetical protein